MIKRTKQRQEMMKTKPNSGVGTLLCGKQENPSNSSEVSDIQHEKEQLCNFDGKKTTNGKENVSGIFF